MAARSSNPRPASGPEQVRPYLRIYYSCANQYTRVYRRPDDPCYVARCPSCGQCKTFRIGPGGSSERFFELTCR